MNSWWWNIPTDKFEEKFPKSLGTAGFAWQFTVGCWPFFRVSGSGGHSSLKQISWIWKTNQNTKITKEITKIGKNTICFLHLKRGWVSSTDCFQLCIWFFAVWRSAFYKVYQAGTVDRIIAFQGARLYLHRSSSLVGTFPLSTLNQFDESSVF